MKTLLGSLQTVVNCFGEFVVAYKTLPLVIGVLLYAFIREKREECEKERHFLIYATVVTVLLLIPITAVAFLLYQTRFYDYGWIWSFVPLTAVLAWGIVTVIWKELSSKSMRWLGKKAWKYLGVVAAVAVLWICGNHGQMQEMPTEIKNQQLVAEAVLQYLEDNHEETQSIVWGPKVMMQYLRSHSGQVGLYYGKDMWDAKSGAYDYEVYTEDEIAGYNWMELLTDERNLYLLEINQATESIHEALAEGTYIKAAMEAEVTCVILPEQITPWIERKMEKAAAETGRSISVAQVDKYTLWLFE